MNWREAYRDKICSPQEAAKKIQSNDIIVTGMTNAIPYAVLDCLYDEIDHLRNVRIDMGFGNRAMRLYLPDARDKVTVRSLFLGPIERAFLKKIPILRCSSYISVPLQKTVPKCILPI